MFGISFPIILSLPHTLKVVCQHLTNQCILNLTTIRQDLDSLRVSELITNEEIVIEFSFFSFRLYMKKYIKSSILKQKYTTTFYSVSVVLLLH